MTSGGRWRRRPTIATSGVATGCPQILDLPKYALPTKAARQVLRFWFHLLLICSRIERAGHSIVVWQPPVGSK